MSDTPRTEAAIDAPMDAPNGLNIVARLTDLCAQLERENTVLRRELLDELESMARQGCHTNKAESDYNGQIAGSLVTSSSAISTHADALRRLAEGGRFRIIAERGRMVVGYWPENDPEKLAADCAAPNPPGR